MVMSVTPTVCITLAFWLGRIGLIASGGCCAKACPAHPAPNRITSLRSESRLREIMVALLVLEFGALCIAPRLVSKASAALGNGNLQLFTKPSCGRAKTGGGERQGVEGAAAGCRWFARIPTSAASDAPCPPW